MHRFRRAAVLAFLLGLALPGRGVAGELVAATPAASNPGQLEMFAYLPPGLPSGAPLVVVLHGCSQTAGEFAAQAGWLELADRLGLALLAPQQTTRNNPSRCFDWFRPADAQRDAGQALSIRQMADQLVATHDLDPGRVFVTGASAGGYMTTALLALYPDVFAGGAVIAGGPYGCADDLASALACMGGIDRSPEAWAEAVRGAPSEQPAAWPRLSVWHGDEDRVVDVANAHELIEQWRAVHELLEVEPVVGAVAQHPRTRYGRPGEAPSVELVAIRMGHAVPVRPGDGAEACGEVGPFAADVGVCAALEIARFWQLTGAGEDEPGGGTNGDATERGCRIGAASGVLGVLLVLLGLGAWRPRRRATPARRG